MDIAKFVDISQGEWISMRSGHSLAFKQFEEIVSRVKIKLLNLKDSNIEKLLASSQFKTSDVVSPFKIEWEAESDWNNEGSDSISSGTCYLIPIPVSTSKGNMLRSIGYAEKISAVSNYTFLNDGTFCITTKYDYTITEERIWFASDNLRCRSSITSSLENKGILQTSFASEIRKLHAK